MHRSHAPKLNCAPLHQRQITGCLSRLRYGRPFGKVLLNQPEVYVLGRSKSGFGKHLRKLKDPKVNVDGRA